MTTNNLLIIGAHIDDFVSAAGAVALAVRAGWQATALTTVGDFASKWGAARVDELRANAIAATDVIGAGHRFLEAPYNIPANDRQLIVGIARTLAELNPRLVLLPWPDDHHPDHRRTAQAAMESLAYQEKFGGAPPPADREILAYEISPWQTRRFDPDLFVSLDEASVETAMGCWPSFREWSPATLAGYERSTRHRLGTWGCVIGRAAAEAFVHLGPSFPLRSFLPGLFGDALVGAGCPQYPHGWRHFASLTS